MILQVGVKVFLENEDNKFLLLKRSSDKYSDIKKLWDLPGGRINVGSSLAENLKREVLEETKLDIINEPRFIYAQDILTEEKHVVRLTFIAKTKGEPMLDGENIEYKWLSLVEMREFSDLDKFVKEILDKNII